MAIRIVRNASGNCIQFVGSSQPAYWNACLSGAVNEEDSSRVDVINDVRTTDTDNPFFEFYGIPYTEFRDREGATFANAAEAAEYITAQANVVTGGAIEFNATDTLDASREATNTNILFSTGDSFGVNAIKAVAQLDGNISIIENVTNGAAIYTDIRPANVTVSGDAPTSVSATAVINTLNALFTVQPLGLGGVDPATTYSTVSGTPNSEVIGDVTLSGGYATKGSNTGEPHNDSISTPVYYISDAGEYIEMDWGAAPNGTTDYGNDFVMGFFSNVIPSNPASEYEGMDMGMRLRGLNTYESHDYGLVIENGYYNNPHTKQKFRMGLDADRRLYISFYDDESEEWQVAVRSAFPTVDETYGVVFYIKEENARFKWSGVTTHEINPASFNVAYRYIESPDGEFYFPLFASEQEANWVDQLNGGAGASHQHVFLDELPTSQTWYMPNTGGTHAASSAPVNPDVTYTEILTGADVGYVPQSYGPGALTINEGQLVNLQIDPIDVNWTTTISGEPAGWAMNGANLMGIGPQVSGIIAENASEEYVITITRTNSFGSATGTLTVTVNNLTASITAITGFTHEATSATMIDEDTLAAGSVVGIDDVIAEDERLVIKKEWIEAYVLPAIIPGNGVKEVYIGFANLLGHQDWTNGINAGDFGVQFSFYCDDTDRAANRFRIGHGYTGVQTQTFVNSTTDAMYDLAFINRSQANGGVMIGAVPRSGGHDMTTLLYGYNTSPWTFTYQKNNSGFGGYPAGDKTIYIASSVGAEMDIAVSATNLYQVSEPLPVSNLSGWTKAVDFSGGSENLQNNSTGSFRSPMDPQNGSNVALPSTFVTNGDPGYTSNDSGARPWATCVVFKPDYHSSNQHIWNYGEGASSWNKNTYLRLDAARGLHFGYNTVDNNSTKNEVYIGSLGYTNDWFGVYIGFNGARFGSPSKSDMTKTWDIRVGSSGGFGTQGAWEFDTMFNNQWTSNLSSVYNHTASMNSARLNIGGRLSNRSFHGKVASFVTTTLRHNQPMPDTTEIEMMVTDPISWLNTYKDGQSYRASNEFYDRTGFTVGSTVNYNLYGAATQVYLMGDGTNDSFSTNIRNQVNNNLSYTQAVFASMVSNDIETVSIPNLP